MKWLLLMVVAINGEISVDVLASYDTMAECHVGGTKHLLFEDKHEANKEMLCFPTDQEVK